MNSARKSENEIERKLTYTASKQVSFICLVALLFLTATSIGISLAIFHVSKRSESFQFELHFKGAADKVLETFVAIPLKFGSLMAMSSYATIQGTSDTTQRWPLVSFPQFEYRVSLADELSIELIPLVSNDIWPEYKLFSALAGRSCM
jgi:hypothetical protein